MGGAGGVIPFLFIYINVFLKMISVVTLWVMGGGGRIQSRAPEAAVQAQVHPSIVESANIDGLGPKLEAKSFMAK